MVTKAEILNPAGLLQAPMSKLKPNNFSTKPRTSLLAAGDSDSPKVTDAPTPLREKKRRRIEATSDEEGEVKKVETPVVSQRRPTLLGRRTSRNEVNYRIAPLSEFVGELERTGGRKDEIIELVSDDDGDFQSQKKVEEDEEEDEEEGEGGGGGEGEEEEEEEDDDGEEEEEGEEEAGESEGEMLID